MEFAINECRVWCLGDMKMECKSECFFFFIGTQDGYRQYPGKAIINLESYSKKSFSHLNFLSFPQDTSKRMNQ